MMRQVHLTSLIFFMIAACGGTEERQEVLSKLRTIGVAASPLVVPPSESAEKISFIGLTVYASLPLGQTATLEPYKDTPGTAIALEPEAITVVPDSTSYEDYNKLRIFKATAKAAIPTTALLTADGKIDLKPQAVRYGFRVIGETREEKVVGSFMVYPPGSDELKWDHPSIDITAPSDGETVATGGVNLDAVVDNRNEEATKIGWFVSTGRVINRRAKETRWEVEEAGEETIIVTAHGRKSRGFAMKVIRLTTQ